MRESHQPRKDHFAVRVKSKEPLGVAEEPAKELEDVAEETGRGRGSRGCGRGTRGRGRGTKGHDSTILPRCVLYYVGVCRYISRLVPRPSGWVELKRSLEGSGNQTNT